MRKTALSIVSAATLALTALTLAIPTASADEKEIAVIVKTTNSNFWQNVNKGAFYAIDGMEGFKMTFQGPASEAAIADEVNIVQNAINRKVAGIVLAPSDPDALVPVAKAAYENGIPLAIIDSKLSDAGKDYYQTFLATDNRKAGELCAQRMIEKIGKKGKIAIMSYVAGVGSEIGRVGGFKDYIEKNSEIEIVATHYSQSQMAKALDQTTDVLAAHPDLDGIFGANEPTAIGMARAIVQSGKAGKITAIGFDGNQDLQEFVKAGTLDAIAVQGSFQMGELGVQAIADLVGGKKISPFINTGVVLVTKDNINSDKAKNVLY